MHCKLEESPPRPALLLVLNPLIWLIGLLTSYRRMAMRGKCSDFEVCMGKWTRKCGPLRQPRSALIAVRRMLLMALLELCVELDGLHVALSHASQHGIGASDLAAQVQTLSTLQHKKMAGSVSLPFQVACWLHEPGSMERHGQHWLARQGLSRRCVWGWHGEGAEAG